MRNKEREIKHPVFSHMDGRGQARMVDVALKVPTLREAVAIGTVRMRPATLRLIKSLSSPKGDVLSAARIAGILGAKKTPEMIPLCHPLNLDLVKIDFHLKRDRTLIRATVRSEGKTGVEMEALTAVAVAALTIYDMCKSADRDMTIENVFLARKSGGRSGTYLRPEKTVEGGGRWQ